MDEGQTTLTYRPTSVDALTDLPIAGKSLLMAGSQKMMRVALGLSEDGVLPVDGGSQITVSATEPTNPQVNDLWLDIS